MKTLGDFLCEATFLEGPFIRTHGRTPNPHKFCSWSFSIDPNADDDAHWYTSTYTTYEKAKEEARQNFINSKHIYVMP